MKQDTLNGSCLCGAVKFRIKNEFDHFQFCHCTQCQKSTGTAHAANLFTLPENISWQSGSELLIRYDVAGRKISNQFCSRCGSRMPWLSLSGDVLVVPAGVLDDAPSIMPKANIFWPERASSYDQGLHAKPCNAFAE